MKRFKVSIFVMSFLLPGLAFSGTAKSLFDMLVMAEVAEYPDGPTRLYEEVSPRSVHHGTKCLFSISREKNLDGRNGTYFYLWFDRPKGYRGSASSTVGWLNNMNDSELEKVLLSGESHRFERHDQGHSRRSPNSVVSVTVEGDKRVIEIRPRDEDEYFAEYNSTYYYKMEFAGDRIVQVEKKHWQKTRFLRRKKLSFHDVCRFN